MQRFFSYLIYLRTWIVIWTAPTMKPEKKYKKHSLANHITRESIDKYIRNFPDSTFRFYYEMQLDEL